MALTLTGQLPAVLSPIHTLPINGTYDPIPAIENVMVEPFFTPLGQTNNVSITDDQGASLSNDDVLSLLLRTIGPIVNGKAEDEMKSLFAQGLINYDPKTPLLVNEVFVSQAAHANRMPNPVPGKIVYAASFDVIPSAKRFLSSNNTDGGEFFASLAYTYAPEALGFWFQDAAEFEDFKAWLVQQTAALSSVLPGDTSKLLNDIAQTNLNGLVEGYTLRKDDRDGNDEYSFARVIVNMLMTYQKQAATIQGTNPTTGVLPFVASELFLPRTIVLVNVDAHARATAKRVDNEWKLITTAIASPVKVVSNKALTNLATLPRALAKAAAQAAKDPNNQSTVANRSAKILFRKQPPTKVHIEKALIRVLAHMKQVARSQNALKLSKSSFTKANRRDPLDFNRPGKITSTRYLPDLHVYVDTSGSISEANYQDAVLMLIRIAKRLNVNLYFTSFSHVMSQDNLLKTKDKSIAQIWDTFRALPKVTGWTDYRQIWDHINGSETLKRRLSLVITDFEWTPSPQRVEHPKNLYYAPCSSMDWSQISHHAQKFVKSMRHIDPIVARKLLGMVQ